MVWYETQGVQLTGKEVERGGGNRDKVMYESETLRPWMKQYASWIALYDRVGRPHIKERLKALRGMCKGRVTRPALLYLEGRDDFSQLVEELKRDENKRARLHMAIHAADMIDLHKEAADNLKEKGEWKELAKYTVPYLDRVWPKKEDEQTQAQIIQIEIGGSDAKNPIATINTDPLIEAVEIVETEGDEGGDL